MTAAKGPTKGPVAWQKFGNEYCLTVQHGSRRVILSASPRGGMTCLVDGMLKPLDPNHPDMELIVEAFNVYAETGLTPRELSESIRTRDERIRELEKKEDESAAYISQLFNDRCDLNKEVVTLRAEVKALTEKLGIAEGKTREAVNMTFQNMLADLNHQVDLKRAAQKERDILKARIGRVTHFVKEFMEEGGA